MRVKTIFLAAALLVLSACSSTADVTSGEASEALVIQGSDTEVQLVSALAEAYTTENPDANISVAGGGSAVGIAALLNGETDITNSSRALNEKERAAAAEKGLDVQEFILARDGLSIVVHAENAVEKLTMAQLASIFSGTVTNWKDVGGADMPIVLYGRQSTSGTFGFFRDTVVKGDYATDLRQMEGNEAIVAAVRNDTGGIGYVGVGYVKDENGELRADMRVVPVAADDASEAVSPLDREAVLSGRYPIFRRIYQYLGAVPAKDSAIELFLRFEVSEAGQALIEKSGFYGLTADDRTQNDALFGKIQ